MCRIGVGVVVFVITGGFVTAASAAEVADRLGTVLEPRERATEPAVLAAVAEVSRREEGSR
jgi:mannose-1-phosphate guanylyltransferase